MASIPSRLALQPVESTFIWLVLGAGGVGASMMMYIKLVYLTGALPSEYYSVRNRAEYKKYQETINMFFPGFQKNK